MVLTMFVLILSLTVSWTFPLVFAALQNITIDDTHGDPVTGAQFTYTPAGSWSAQPGCAICEAHPDASDAYDGTWHDTSFLVSSSSGPLNASVSFTGSAVYVYCIITNSDANPDGNSDLWFMIDGDMVGSLSRSPPGGSTFLYNYNVYANDQLSMGAHTLTVINGQTNGPQSLILLDYVVYTTGSEDQPSIVTLGTTSPASAAPAVVQTETTIIVSSDGTPSTNAVPITSVIHASTVVETEDATVTTVSGGSTQVSVVQTVVTETSVLLGPSHTAAGNTTALTTNRAGGVVSTLIYASTPSAPSTSSTADSPPARVASGPGTLTRTIGIAVSVVGGILLLVIAAGFILWRRRRQAESEPRDFRKLLSSPTPHAGQSDDWPEDRLTTTLSGIPHSTHLRRTERKVLADSPTSMTSSVQECTPDGDQSWTAGAFSRNQTHGVPDDDGDSWTAESPITSESVVEISTNRRHSGPRLRLPRSSTFYNSYSEAASQDYSDDAASDVPPSERTLRTSTTAATYGGVVTTPILADDSFITSPSVPRIPVRSDNAKTKADFKRRGGGTAISPVLDQGGTRTTDLGPDHREDQETNRRFGRFGFVREVTPPPSYRSVSPDSIH